MKDKYRGIEYREIALGKIKQAQMDKLLGELGDEEDIIYEDVNKLTKDQFKIARDMIHAKDLDFVRALLRKKKSNKLKSKRKCRCR